MDTQMHDYNPLKRSFTDMMNTSSSSSSPLRDDHTPAKQPAFVINPRDFVPRSYQLKVFEVALRRNTIAVLETGAGKTMIAVMLINHIGQAIKSSGNKKLIIFLAPRVLLVRQHYEEIKILTNFEVGEYSGAKGVDAWTQESWKREIDEHDVLVMTPQVLLNALEKAFLNLELVSLIILDECHHATGKHAYAKIMKGFYHKLTNKPKVFGMTASPVVRKGVSSAIDCEDQISELERILNSQVYTIEDTTEMEVYVPSARGMCKFYDKAQFCYSDLKAEIEASWSKFENSMLNLQGSTQSCFKDLDDKIKMLRKHLSKDHAKILNCLEDLGLICAYEAVKVCQENIPNSNEECETYREVCLRCKYFLEEVLSIIDKFLHHKSLLHDDKFFFQCEFDYIKAVDLGYISPKLHELLQLFLSFGAAGHVLCLIFVEKIITAKVIERFVKKVSSLAHFKVSYLTGSNTSSDALPRKLQLETLESFRSGKVNLLFTTDVVEEGIHIPNCSRVIRFDLPRRVCSYVQSRGRARQNDSLFISMLERGNIKHRNQLFDIIRSEWSMIDTAINRDPDVWSLKACMTEDIKAYYVNSTGASVTADSSVSLIYLYCEKLPGDRYYTPRPTFEFEPSDQSCKCKINFPPNAALQTIVGPEARSKHLAKQLVCLEACKKLHQMGALDDHLVPSIEGSSESILAVKGKETSAGAGTTKRKELHGKTCIRALSGTWGEKLDGATFYAYKFDFSCSVFSEMYSGFILLIESKLDDDVGNTKLDLFLVSKTVKSTVSSCGEVHLDAEQMKKAKFFHEFFFNGLFGRLFTRSKSSGAPREFLLKEDARSLWSSSYMYLLLPLETLKTSNNESWRINWSGIDACYSLVEFLKNNPFMKAENCNGDRSPSPQRLNSSVTGCNTENSIQFANVSMDMNNLKHMVVLAVHTGRMYSIVELVSDKTAESAFEDNPDVSFAEYFNTKYGIVLKHPGQCLLRLKQSHNPHNLLVNFNDEGPSKVKKPQQHAYMPPELLLRVGVPLSVLKSCYLLPSLMHRLESLMLASQLRQEIDFHAPNVHIPSSMMLEAITTLGCCEYFSMERLELLGDSVLKYTVSCYLFLKYQDKHEGQLSALRSSAICNSTLHKVGTCRKLQGYIRDCAFDPRRWVAPGQRSLHPVPCTCGVETLEVPLDAKFQTEDTKVKVGKSCDMGHRWMGSKTISDCVEAIIGAYYIGGGLIAALHVMKWLGIDAEIDPSLVVEAITTYSLRSYIPKEDEVKILESKIGYTFSVKFLVQEAMTHASKQEQGVSYCYERLEFLGDSVLDLLITLYLYQSHTDIDPGLLTDLRSASVNNENFAQVAVRHDLYKHLQHSSQLLFDQITEYVQSFNEFDEATRLAQGPKGPKPLGDLVESIVGAVLIDTKLNLDDVWRIFKPLLSPIVTPEKLELPPRRELIELCDSLGYFIKEKSITKGEMVHVELKVQLNDDLLVAEGLDQKRKVASGKAASLLLKELEHRGIAYSRIGAKRRKQDTCLVDLPSLDLANEPSSWLANHLEQKLEKQFPSEPNVVLSPAGSTRHETPVIGSINLKKGGPRNTLFELCKKLQWPMPTFETEENKSRSLMEIGEGTNKRTAFNSFVSIITLKIPGFGVIDCKGDPRADKKSSFDSAALFMLYKLQEEGQVVIGESK